MYTAPPERNIVITEIPYTISGNKMKLVENLASLAKEKVFDEIYDVRDESSKEGIRIVIGRALKFNPVGNSLNQTCLRLPDRSRAAQDFYNQINNIGRFHKSLYNFQTLSCLL